MDESTIIAGLQIFIFVFLVAAGIAFVWIGISNARIRAVFKANLPNHLDLFRNRAQSQIESQVAASVDSNGANKSPATSPKRQISDDSKRRKNFLPATLTPYGTKSSFSSKEDIVRESFEMQQEIINIPDNEEEEEKSEKDFTSAKSSRNTSASSLQLFKSIQKEGDQMAEDMKKQEKERKKKEREEKQNKQKEIEEKAKKEAEKEESNSGAAATTGTTGGFSFNFGGASGGTTGSGFNFNLGGSTSTTATTAPAASTATTSNNAATTTGTGTTGLGNFNFSFGTKT